MSDSITTKELEGTIYLLRETLRTLVRINERRADLPNEHPPEPHEIEAWKKATALAWNGGTKP